MDPILIFLIIISGAAAVLLYLRLFGPRLHRAVRILRILLTPSRRPRREGPPVT
jgi:hypothetical protein